MKGQEIGLASTGVSDERGISDEGESTRTPDSEETARDATTPDRVGRYVVTSERGAGAMGVVVVAHDPELDRQLAIKLIHPRVARRAEARARMLREAKGLARLSHPNVVQVYDAGTIDGRVFIAMELVDGEPLSDWQAAAERSVGETLAVYLQAGRGLAAAHQAGLVHRDFKPDNVLVDRELRARVLDFGLVRAADELAEAGTAGASEATTPADAAALTLDDEVALAETHESGPALGEGAASARMREASGAGERSSSSELELDLTRGGAIMGTPAYMSPEQWRGARADARSDQFSFCVALWEALYGERPFAGRTLHALAAAVTSGRRVEPPGSLRLPRRVRAALERGLDPKPERRYPSMDALLADLSRDDWTRRSLPLAALALAAFAVLAWGRFAGVEGAPVEAPSCDQAGDAIEGEWGEAQARAIDEAFTRSESIGADQALSLVHAGLDDYADRWRGAAEENCAATVIRNQQSTELLDLRAQCLDHRRMEFAALVEVLSRADADTVDQALAAIEGLPSLRACEAHRVLETGSTLPDDEALAQEVQEARAEIAGVRASFDTGRFAEAEKRLEPLIAKVQAIDYPHLHAELAVERGRVLGRGDRHVQAGKALQEAFFTAVELHDDDLALRAATWLAELEGAQRQRPEFARLWADQAHALLERAPDRRPGIAADLADTLSWNAYLAGDLQLAREEAQRGLALLDEAGLDAPTRRMALLLDRGAAEFGLEALVDARASFEGALEIAEEIFGRDNPKSTGALNNLAYIRRAGGELDQARALLQETVDIRKRSLGADNISYATALSNLADLHIEQGNGAAALKAAGESYEILEAALGPQQVVTVLALQRRGLARALTGDYEGALADLRAVYDQAAAPPRPDRQIVAQVPAELAVVLAAAGRQERARAELEAALAIEPERWAELAVAGRFAVVMGQDGMAVRLLGHAIALANQIPGGGTFLVQAQLSLAELLVEDDPERARATLDGVSELALAHAPTLAASVEQLGERLGGRGGAR